MLRACMFVALSTQVWVSESQALELFSVDLMNYHNDIVYLSNVEVGGQKVQVMFDTTVSHSWLPSTTALKGRSTKRTTPQAYAWGHYDIDEEEDSESDTLTELNTTFEQPWGKGRWFTGGLTGITTDADGFDFEFALIDELTSMETFEPRPYDGVLGLGFNEEGEVPLLKALRKAGKIDKSVFAFHLGWGPSGHLHLQEPDKSGKFMHDPRYLGLENAKDAMRRWSVPLDAVWFGDNDISLHFSSAVFSPASPFVMGPKRDTEKFMKRWGAESYMEYDKVDCDTDGPSLAFRLNGRDYTLKKDDLILKFGKLCFLAVKPDPNAMTTKAWTLGAPFHRKFYTIFDADEKRVGLAEARHAD